MQRIAFNIKDDRLRSRIRTCFERMSKEPQKSFPQIFKEPCELEAFYRLINNERVEVESLVEAISQHTAGRLSGDSGDLLAIHDTTKVAPRSSSEEAFGPLQSSKNRGFHAHVSLIADLAPKPRVYGVGDVFFWVRPHDESKDKFEEGLRWFNQVKSVEQRLSRAKLIHVMDREGDSYQLFSDLVGGGFRFVVRLAHNRLLESGEHEHLFEELGTATTIAERSVRLSYRKKSKMPRRESIFPSRESRQTKLSISAKTVQIKISGWLKRKQKHNPIPGHLELNVVRVWEENPPNGEDPVEWFLITNEPIETQQQVLKIVDIYRRRWLIEEFFKALKTGCQIQTRLISSLEPWYRMFCLFLPIAATLINLRTLEELTIEETQIITDAQLTILVLIAKKRNHQLSTVSDLKLEIARLGGHIKSTGPPGWLVLARGLEELQKMEIGWSLHRDM
jgi:hypothetical protein